MAFTYRGNASSTATAATEIDCNRPSGVQVGDLIVGVFAFEGVAAGSGPWIIPNSGQFSSSYIGPAQGWQQACWQTPGATGVGVEVWCALHGTGTVQNAMFAASQNAVTVTVAYGGEYNPNGSISGGAVRVATTSQVAGNQPAAPSVNANNGELIVACAGDLMTASKFGTPSGTTNRVDVTRSGAGTVEATIADLSTVAAGNTGPITFPNAAASGTTRGATATLAIRQAPSTPGAGAIINAGLPADLDIGPGYTLQVTALDPTTGNPVTGVTVSNLIFTADQISGTPEGLEVGPFMLVPGPNDA